MKMIRQRFSFFGIGITATLLLLLLSCFGALAQAEQEPQPEKLRQLIKESDYVFEGKALEETARAYASEDETKFYYSVLVKITKVFKGNLKPGTIELISKKDYLPFGIEDGVRYSITVFDGGPNGVPIDYDSEYIFFAKETDLLPDPEKKDISIDNPEKVDVEDGYYSLLEFAPTGIQYHYGPYNTSFDTEKDVYDFLQSAGVSVPDSIYKNALDYNVYRRAIENQSKVVEKPKVEVTAEEKIQGRINRYQGLIKWRKMRGSHNGEEDQLLKKYEKQLAKWERKMEKLKKKK